MLDDLSSPQAGSSLSSLKPSNKFRIDKIPEYIRTGPIS